MVTLSSQSLNYHVRIKSYIERGATPYILSIKVHDSFNRGHNPYDAWDFEKEMGYIAIAHMAYIARYRSAHMFIGLV